MPRKTILVIKLGALGDFIQALGPMAAIRRHHPHDNLILLTTAPYIELGKACGYFDEVWQDPRPRWYQPYKIFGLYRKLKNAAVGRVYDLQNNDRTTLYFRLFSSKPEWVGVAPGASHRNISKSRTSGTSFQGHVETLALAGIDNVQIDTLTWMAGRADFPGLQKPYVLLVPGSSPKHPAKRWPGEFYGTICNRLLEHNIQPVLIGGNAEATSLKLIEQNAPGTLNLCGQTRLEDIAVLARGAVAALGNDTGPMHLIAPTGCRCLILFSGQSEPHRHAPPGDNVLTLQRPDLRALAPESVWEVLAPLAGLVVVDRAKAV